MISIAWIILIILILILILFVVTYPLWKPKAMGYVTKKIVENMPKIEDSPAELHLNDSRTAAKLTYFHKNKEHTLYIPYDKKLLRKVGYTVYHEMDGKKVDITQEPGIPYLVTAGSLGGGEIKVYKDEEVSASFKDGDVVKF